MSNQVEYLPKDFFRVKPVDGIAVQIAIAARTIGGLNKGLCDKFPGLTELLTSGQDQFLTMGSVLVYDEADFLLAAVVGQVFPGAGNTADPYEARRKAFWDGLQYICEENPERTLYVPYMICCGQAGDDWSIIEAMLLDLPNDVKICVPKWAESAAEMLGRLPMLKPPAVSEMGTDDVHTSLKSYKITA